MTLFHYCGTHAFWSIVEHQSIWLSDLSASNDSEEGRWASKLFMQLAATSPEEHSVWPFVGVEVAAISDKIPTLGFCLSRKEDMLSQWRGYADDASGFSIGFDDDFLAQWTKPKPLPELTLEKVRYTTAAQVDLLRERIVSLRWNSPMGDLATIEEIESMMLQQLGRGEHAMNWVAIMLYDLTYLMKNPAFAEEEETRLIARADLSNPAIKFRVRGSSLIPYLVVDLNAIASQPLQKVFIGPKNPTPVSVVKAFLKKYDFGDVDVVKSAATYR